MINLDYKSRVPIYEQIVNEIERYVVLGILKPEEQLPSVREMATELGINPNTVKKAYTELERKNEKEKKELNLQKSIIDIKKKYGKNAIVRGMNLKEGATAMDRNRQIGGHHE